MKSGMIVSGLKTENLKGIWKWNKGSRGRRETEIDLQGRKTGNDFINYGNLGRNKKEGWSW